MIHGFAPPPPDRGRGRGKIVRSLAPDASDTGEASRLVHQDGDATYICRGAIKPLMPQSREKRNRQPKMLLSLSLHTSQKLLFCGNSFGLLFVDIVAGYVMRMLVTYLTDVWKLSLVHATSIVNIWEGAAKALPLAVALLSLLVAPVSSCCATLLTPLIESAASLEGLGLLTLSTPPLLGHSTGTCTHYQAECIGTTQKILFFTALPLVAVGMASIYFVFAAISEVVGEEELTQEEVYSSHSLFLLPNYIGGVTFSYIKPWSVRFGIPAICCVVITMCYMSFSCLDIALLTSGDWVEESPLTKVIRVFVASASKVYHKLDGVKLYEKTNTPSLPRTRWLRCLDKAAIILPNKSRDEQENDKWTLCTVTEV
ncbi:hypothetical protein Sango_2644100 [Sesamum angolense]|uniref:Uncharacterized protein n=1 Tax=Sesamum angolense TaxID=2727404 RepID=A0AAE1W1T5_9LAMI|nr:hypothetical protein Sango_2644100 [Sesamum angolense]